MKLNESPCVIPQLWSTRLPPVPGGAALLALTLLSACSREAPTPSPIANRAPQDTPRLTAQGLLNGIREVMSSQASAEVRTGLLERYLPEARNLPAKDVVATLLFRLGQLATESFQLEKGERYLRETLLLSESLTPEKR